VRALTAQFDLFRLSFTDDNALILMDRFAHAIAHRTYLVLYSAQNVLRLAAVDTLKGYFKALEYEYRVKTVALGTLK
jgi:hypothetical protein